MRKLSKKTMALVAGSLVVATVGGGVAFAYWSTTGSGTGTGSTTAGKVDVLTFSQNTLSPMFPGDSSQPLTVTVTNPSGENVFVGGVKAYLTVTGTCGADDFLLGGTAAPSDIATARSLAWTAQDLAHNGGNANATSTIQFSNKATNQDGCKSATVTVHYLAS